jgi:hypothetical protein
LAHGDLFFSGLRVAGHSHQEQAKCSRDEPANAEQTPVVPYRFENHGGLPILRCAFSDCIGWDERITPEARMRNNWTMVLAFASGCVWF